MKLSVIVPTVGRPTLIVAIKDLLAEMIPEDEILVVGDGPQPDARAIAEGIDPRVRYLEHGPTRNWGHSQRNATMAMAQGTHIMFLDDDDRVVIGALPIIRSKVDKAPDKVHLFRMFHRNWVVWENHEIRIENVSTQMVIVPNIPERLGVWGNRYEGDFDFIMSTVALYPNRENDVVWNEEITTVHGLAGGLSEYQSGLIRAY